MSNESKYVCIDHKMITSRNILLLKYILHTVNVLNIDKDKFYLVTDNDPEKLVLNENDEIVSLAEDANIYIATKTTDESGQEMFAINDLLTDAIEDHNGVTITKYDIITFDLSGVTCKGMVLGFNNCEGISIYIETLVNIDDGLSIIYLAMDDESNIQVIEPMDPEIITNIAEKLE